MAEISTQDQQVKKVKRFLESWRLAVPPLKSVFLWEEQWHPAAILGVATFFHFLFWILDLNFITMVAVVGLLINLIDFLVPIVCNSLMGPSSWTGQHEKIFEDTCKSLVSSYNAFIKILGSFYSLRVTSPYMYYVISISTLCVLAWIASTINNIFILYMASVTLMLWPGVQNRGLFNKFYSLAKKNK